MSRFHTQNILAEAQYIFFMSKSDAQNVLVELLDVNDLLRDREIYPVKVKLISAIKGITAGAANPFNANGFVVHSPNEVFEFVQR